MKTTYPLITALTILITPALFAGEPAKPEKKGGGEVAKEQAAKPYPLDACLVSGEKLGSMGDPVAIIHDGREIKFCCDSCEPEFKADPAKYLAKLNKP